MVSRFWTDAVNPLTHRAVTTATAKRMTPATAVPMYNVSVKRSRLRVERADRLPVGFLVVNGPWTLVRATPGDAS